MTPIKHIPHNLSGQNPAVGGSSEPVRKICRLWLTWKLIKNQKLRTTTIFCGLLFSCFLLCTFGNFGYDFWAQVHEGADEATIYDQTQLILISLVTVLLLLVAACSGILLHNLYSLTFAQRWRSLTRLIGLGAGSHDIIAMTVLENVLLYCTAVPPGYMLALLSADTIGIQSGPPLWLMGGILLWIWSVSCLCSIRPLWAALHRPLQKSPHRSKMPAGGTAQHLSSQKTSSANPSPESFSKLMRRKYRQANRRHHARIIMTVLAAILLYVPASYLIETNISVQRAGLDATYGIQYSCSPQNKTELAKALNECRRLAQAGGTIKNPAKGNMLWELSDGRTSPVIYVSLSASASVKTSHLSDALHNLVCSMGWPEDVSFSADCTIYFLEDQAYAQYLESCGLSVKAVPGRTEGADSIDEPDSLISASPTILIDRYVNRRRWSEDAAPSYQEVPLLNARKDCSGVEAYYEIICEVRYDESKTIVPDAVTRQIPEGLDFNGDLSLILPLSRLEDFLSPRISYLNMYVHGKFQDMNGEASFLQLEDSLGADSLGDLRYMRKILQEWYSSMNGIHRAMTAICSLLFFIAALNIFSMMLFQYIERKKGLAILWSLGQSPGELLRILAGEHIWNLLAAISLGIPISGLLCYYIYRIFRQVWHMDFAFPLRQTALIVTAACFLSVTAILTDGLLMRRQDFLKDIRDIT